MPPEPARGTRALRGVGVGVGVPPVREFLASAEIWEEAGVSKQGAMNLPRPLLEVGLVEKVGSRKTGRYALRKP